MSFPEELRNAEELAEGNKEESRLLSRVEVERLIDAGIIGENQREAVLAHFRRGISWRPWMARWSAAIGAVFLLAGIIFFFAWNWKELSPFVRFTVLEAAVVLSVGAAIISGIGRPLGQWLLLAGSVFTGVLLAVFGQVYQTGADSFEVFAYWAAFILVWAVVAKFAPLWVLWLVVFEVAIATFAGQVLIPEKSMHPSALYLVLGLVSVLAASGREWAECRESGGWLRGEWLRLLLVGVSLFWLSVIPWEVIFEFEWRDSGTPVINRWLGILAWLGACGGGAWFYTFKRPSLTSVGFCSLALAVIATAWLGRIIIEISDDSPVTWLMASLVALLVFAGAAVLITRSSKVISGGDAISAGKEAKP